MYRVRESKSNLQLFCHFFGARLKGPVIRATFFFNLSRNIVAVQVETLCCAYYRLYCDHAAKYSVASLQNFTRIIGQYTIASRDQFKPIRIGEDLVVN